MAKITINGREIEAPEGASLLEVASAHGYYIPALCYIEKLPPYAGCRMCVVDIEGARGPQLACTTRISDSMVIQTDTPEILELRKAVLSMIMANHSDRCLTCHRRVHCMPGDICLRDGVVTHRCLTCSKNYRCELQRTCELVDTVNYEPWLGEERTYYSREEQPPADRANPWFEFDPQMCIICTRCIRACDEIRHTTAIGLADRGYDTHIAFGAGGPIHESTCDFCGACIDVCPTATLMENPNKWEGLAETWVSTACNSCSVGCTLSIGTAGGRPVVVKPDALNPVSFRQICVRGRFHYDAVDADAWLREPLLRRDDALVPATWDEALDEATNRLAELREQHGPQSIGFLGSPVATNEENFLLAKLAREVAGSGNIDFTTGAVARATAETLTNAFGTEALPADLSRLATAGTLVVIADDLESSHNVAALRVKDAVVYAGGKLIVVSPHYGEVCDFATVWLRPRPGGVAATVDALARAVAADPSVSERLRSDGVEGLEHLAEQGEPPPGIDAADLQRAASILLQATGEGDERHLAIIFAPDHPGVRLAGKTAKAAANLAIACRGKAAADCLHLLPTDANVNGARDMGVQPSESTGLDFAAMMTAAREGSLKALVVAADNPLLYAPDKTAVRAALSNLDFLLVIDSLPTDTALLADIVLPSMPTYARDGTSTSADRHLLKLNRAIEEDTGQARQGWQILEELSRRLGERLGISAAEEYAVVENVTTTIASSVPAYRSLIAEFVSGQSRTLSLQQASRAAIQAVERETTTESEGDFILTTGRSLYTSLEGASIHSPEADKLHREEFVEVNPADAARLGVEDSREVVLANERGDLAIRARITDAVLPGVLFVPLHYDGGAVTALFPPEGEGWARPRVKLTARVRA